MSTAQNCGYCKIVDFNIERSNFELTRNSDGLRPPSFSLLRRAGSNGAVMGCYGTLWCSYGMLWDLIGQLWDVLGPYGAIMGCYGTLWGRMDEFVTNRTTLCARINELTVKSTTLCAQNDVPCIKIGHLEIKI